MRKVKFKRLHQNAKLPTYATEHANGADLYACNDEAIMLRDNEQALIPLGFSMKLPNGYGAYLIPRSGLGHKKGLVLGNLIGLVDADYVGQVFISAWKRPLTNIEDSKYALIKPGERIAQMCIIETRQFEFEWVEDLEETERGDGGFGHSCA